HMFIVRILRDIDSVEKRQSVDPVSCDVLLFIHLSGEFGSLIDWSLTGFPFGYRTGRDTKDLAGSLFCELEPLPPFAHPAFSHVPVPQSVRIRAKYIHELSSCCKLGCRICRRVPLRCTRPTNSGL